MKVKKQNICNLIIVDASGSMSGKEEEVTGGVNMLFENIKKESKKKKHLKNTVILTDFSSHDDFRVLIDRKGLKELKKLKKGDYMPRAMTALYDAIGKSFQLVPKSADAVFVTIFTDGLENDSKEFTADTIRKMIESKKKDKWGIVFMGTSESAMLQAGNIGISQGNMFRYADTKAGTAKAMSRMSKTRTYFETAIAMDTSLDDMIAKTEYEGDET